MLYSATSPRRAYAVVMRARDDAKRTSATRAWTNPMPAHAPLIAATSGLRSPSAYVCGLRSSVRIVPRSAVARNTSMWGSDYPHLEGTFGHTQKTLHELFDDVDPEVSYRIRLGAFKELFPHVSDPPGEGSGR